MRGRDAARLWPKGGGREKTQLIAKGPGRSWRGLHRTIHVLGSLSWGADAERHAEEEQHAT